MKLGMINTIRMKYLQKISLNCCLAFIILVTVLILGKGINTSEFLSADAAHHGMDGIFVLDFVRDHPVFNIYDYAVQYYTKYPALKIGFYPPFFAAVEALFYAIFGISVFSARLTVLFFAIIAMIYWFKLIRLIYNEKIAFYSCLLFITTPYVVEWSKTVMLEMPALAMIIVAVYCFYHYIERNTPGYKYYFILSTIAAVYTKQTAVFIIPLFFLYILFTKKHKRLLDKEVLLIGAALLLLVLPLAIITLKFGGTNIEQSIGDTGGRGGGGFLRDILVYPKFLPNILTYPALILSVISFFFIKKYFYKSILFFAWIISFYLLFTYMNVRVIRYAYFWLPPFFLFASLPLDKNRWKIKNVSFGIILFILIFCYQFYSSFSYNKPLFSGYEDAAKYILGQQTNKVFCQGSGIAEGNFIYQIRRLDKKRRMVVYRGSKILASYAMYANKSLVEHVKNKEEIQSLFDDYGLEFFVIEEPINVRKHGNIKAFKLLREVLRSKEYSLIKTIRLKKERSEAIGELILIYKINKETSVKRDVIHMRLPIIGTEITVPLKQLSNFYTPSKDSVSISDIIKKFLLKNTK